MIGEVFTSRRKLAAEMALTGVEKLRVELERSEVWQDWVVTLKDQVNCGVSDRICIRWMNSLGSKEEWLHVNWIKVTEIR